MPGKIFISYRREDSQWIAGRLYDKLLGEFSEKDVFMDVDSIEPGENFETYITNYIAQTTVFLALIGPKWLSSINEKINVKDFVRIEIANALKKNIKVIPVLLGNTPMPSPENLPDDLKELCEKNAYTLNPQTFNFDAKSLINKIKQTFYGTQSRSNNIITRFVFANYRMLLLSLAILLVAFIGCYYWYQSKATPPFSTQIVGIKMTSPAHLIITDMSTGYTVFPNDNEVSTLCMYQNVTILRMISENKLQNKGTDPFFYYRLEAGNINSPQLINFKQIGNKLYVDNKLKAICVNDSNFINNFSLSEINDIETITVDSSVLNDVTFASLQKIIEENPYISLANDEGSERISQLMKLTKPKVLICSKIERLSKIDLSIVDCVIVTDNRRSLINPNFYQSLEQLGHLRNLVLVKMDTIVDSKISAESITYYEVDKFDSLFLISNKTSIRQLHIIGDGTGNEISDFSFLKNFDSLKSFGYYETPNGVVDSMGNKIYTRKPNIASVKGMVSINMQNADVSDMDRLAANNPNLEHLAISFSDTTPVSNLNWVINFKKLRSLSIEKAGDDQNINIDSIDINGLKKLKYLKSFAVDSEISQNQRNKLNIIVPGCNFYTWTLIPSLCMGSGWLLLYLFFFVVLIAIKTQFQKKSIVNHKRIFDF